MRRLSGEGPGRQRRPEPGKADRLGEREPFGAGPDRAAAGPAGGNHCGAARDPVGEENERDPADQHLAVHIAVHRPGDDQRAGDRGDREEGREQGSRLDLAVVQMGGAQPLVAGVEIARLRPGQSQAGLPRIVSGYRRVKH